MVRVQIRLTEQQTHALRQLAASQGGSMSAVIREALDAALTAASAERIGRARAAIGRFASGARIVSREHDHELDRAFGT